jgi:N-acetylglucosaminyldiphosphoundecaprenol N-acetyl-beta-D-mannosaminyltransferase
MQPDRVLQAIRQNPGRALRVVLVNPHTVMTCRRRPDVRSALESSEVVLPDGVGITLAARLLGLEHITRVPGANLMLYLCDHGRKHRLRHYFHGGKPGVAERLAGRLGTQFPGLEIVGWDSPPLSNGESPLEGEHCRTISAARPDIVWVGLGSPKQELWLTRNSGRISARAVIGIGAAFDFHSGAIKRAPSLIRCAGLEWLYRLTQEPLRLWRRNLDSPSFLIAALRDRLVMSESPLTSGGIAPDEF